MEPNNSHTQALARPDFPWLPKECNFTMQQWLYRRTLHTKRYKKRYVVLHNERLYTFTKLPSFDKFDAQNLHNLLRLASNSWILTGAFVSADPDINNGLYRWKIQFKNYKKPVSGTETLNKFLLDKPELNIKYVDNLDSIFADVTSSVLENKSMNTEAHDCLWFATTNHKIASDWVIALIHTSRYGSLYNLIYKNPSRRRYQQFKLPWYLMALDYMPNLSKDENSKQPLTSFTYIKIDIHRVFEFPMLPNAKIYCAVEFNSSFYILQLYRYESENSTSTPTGIPREDDAHSTLNYYVNKNTDYGITRMNSDDYSSYSLNRERSIYNPEIYGINYKRIASIGPINEDMHESLPMNSMLSSSASVANSLSNLYDEDSQNVLTRLLNLNPNKNIEKKQVAEKRSIVYKDACVYVPVYKNTTQEVVWLHFFGDFDVYMGTASIRDVDFGSRDPAPVKTCMIKLIDSLNPLNYKRVDISTYKGESTVLKKSTAKTISNDRGFVEVSVIIPKHLGNFLDPVTISYGSPKEYLATATRSPITVGIQMLISNIKRVRQSFTVFKDIIHALKSVLEFRSRISSFMAMLYFILVFGIFPNRMLIIFLLPLIVYILCTHPSFIDLTFVFLLKFPILIAILPKRLIHPFLLIPKTSCILCSKKPSFLEKNAQVVDPDMVTKVEISSRTFQYTSNKKMHSTKSLYSHASKMDAEASELPEVITNPFSAANAIQINTGSDENNQASERNPNESTDKDKETTENYVDFEKRISVHLNSLPMITSKHLLNDSIEITRYKGTRIETCKHRGIIMSYLSTMFINEMGVSLFDSVQGDGLSIIKGYHDIYYNTPPYRHVPFWANVKFTVYFFMYMLYLTFFGGISNQQLLHLLHRNKLMCRLTLESTGVVDPKSKAQRTTSKPKTDTMYENERRILFGKFSKLNLRFYERGIFSTEDGKFISVDLSKHVIRLVVNENTDPEGWMYAKNWNSPFSRDPSSMSFVRRRKWLLTAKEKSSEYVLKRSVSSTVTPDYFTNMNSIQTKSKTTLDQDSMSVSSLDSCMSTKASNAHIKNFCAEVAASDETADGEHDLHHGGKGAHMNGEPVEMNHPEVTNIDRLGREDNTERLEMTIEADENVARLYMRKGKIRGMMDRFRDMRERKRNQRQDNSDMQKYLSTLVSNKKPGFGQNLPRRLQLLKRFKEARKAASNKRSVASDTNHSLDEVETASLHSLKFPKPDLHSIGVSSMNSKSENNLIASLMNLNRVPTIQEDDASRSTTQRNSGSDEGMLELRSDSSHLNQLGNNDEVFTPQPPYSKLPFKRAQRDSKGKQFPRLTSLSKVPSETQIYTSKIAKLVNYLNNLYQPEDKLETDRSSYSTITQTSTGSMQGMKGKSKFRRMMETVFVILFALPVCIVLDLGKLLVGMFWLTLNTLLGIQEPEQLKGPTVTDRVPKRRAKCKIVKRKDWVQCKLMKPRRCFLLGERLKVYKKICHAENLSLVHSMNKLMFDSSQKFEYESDVSSEAESDSSLMTMRDGDMEKSYSNQYVDDSDVLVESDLGSANRDDLVTDDDLDELKTLSINPFDLDDSDEELLNMMRRSYDSNDQEIQQKKGKKKKGKIVNYISTIYFKRMAKKGKYIDEQHLSDYEHDSDDNTKNDNKIGLIATLKKVKDQIIMANYKINLYNMRFEKFLNMFSWKNYSVTTIVLFLLLLVIFLNLLFRIEIIMLAYILIQFKSGYRRGTWERIILSTTERHINKAIVDLEIFRPFWDLSTHQIQMLSNRIKSFSSIELDINTIREAKDELHLSHIVTDRLIATKFAKNWRRYRWINHLFRQAPCKQY